MFISFRLQLAAALGLMAATAQAVDVPCVEAVSQKPKAQVSTPLLSSGISLNHSLAAAVGNLGIADRIIERAQQVNFEAVKKDARKSGGLPAFSPAENSRIKESRACDASVEALQDLFEEARPYLTGYPADRGLESFVAWYVQASTLELSNTSVAQLVKGQRTFAEQCLRKDVPPELNPLQIQSAVGLLTFERKEGAKTVVEPLCGALRVSLSRVRTALHCFASPSRGDVHPRIEQVRRGQVKLWFQYEAEPGSRYEVCTSSIPDPGAGFSPDEDSADVTIAPTPPPAPQLRFSAGAPPAGSSLYMRGYFPFSEDGEAPVLAFQRSTAYGGCSALRSAGRCLLHGCQSTPLMSGSPVFLRPEPNQSIAGLDVVGIHLGAASLGAARSTSTFVCEDFNGNEVSSANFAYQPERP